MDFEEIQELVEKTVATLPQEFKERIENVSFVVEDWPSPQDLETMKKRGGLLLGLYRGIPNTKRGGNYNGVLPDKISIFAGPILMLSHSKDQAEELIKETVLHEIGHYFGLSDERIYKAQGHSHK